MTERTTERRVSFEPGDVLDRHSFGQLVRWINTNTDENAANTQGLEIMPGYTVKDMLDDFFRVLEATDGKEWDGWLVANNCYPQGQGPESYDAQGAGGPGGLPPAKVSW